MASRIITTHYRYKRQPKKPNPAALAMPRIVTAKKPTPRKPGDPPILSWFLRIECDRCGKVQMVNETADSK